MRLGRAHADGRVFEQKKKTPLLSRFVGFGDGVSAMATRGADAFVVAGEKLAVFSLDDRPPDGGVVLGTVPVAPLRLRARNGAKVRAQLTGVAILPRSRLFAVTGEDGKACLLYTSPSPRDGLLSRMPSSA